MPATEPDLSASRYGRRSGRLSQRTWIVISVVGVSLGVLAAFLVSKYQTDGAFQADVVAFDVLSDHEISVTVRVLHGSGDPAECEVAAQAQDRSYVGEKTFEIPATVGDDAVVTDTVATERRAVTAVMLDCHVAD